MMPPADTIEERRAAERVLTDELARRFMEKWPAVDRAMKPPAREYDWFAILEGLAGLQAAYDARGGRSPLNLYKRAVVLLSRKMPRDEAAFIATLGAREHGEGFPIVTVRNRANENLMGQAKARRKNFDAEDRCEQIGRAVLFDYLRQLAAGKANLRQAFVNVAALGEVDGDAILKRKRSGGDGAATVEAQYLAYRKMSLARGYADARAVQIPIMLNQLPTPDRDVPADRLWLDQFPSMKS